MKVRLVVLMLLATLILSGCDSKNTPTQTETLPQIRNIAQEFGYAKQLGDAAVAYFLGKDYDKAYSFALLSIEPYVPVDVTDTVQLDPEVCKEIERVYNRVLKMAAGLPVEGESVQENPWDGMTYTQMAKAYAAGEIELPERILNVLVTYGYLTSALELPPGIEMWEEDDGIGEDIVSDTSEIHRVIGVGEELTDSYLKKVFFPDGVAPNIDAVSDEFRAWFISTAKQAGLLDKRLFETSKGIWCISAEQYVNGDKEFRAFDKFYRVSDEYLLKTPYAVQKSPVYNMVLDSYRFYDTGMYTAEYVTDASSGADTTIRIRVSFKNTNVAGTSGSLESYLAGIKDIAVTIIK